MNTIENLSKEPKRLVLLLVLLLSIAIEQRGKFTLTQLEDFRITTKETFSYIHDQLDQLPQTYSSAYTILISETLTIDERQELLDLLGIYLEEFETQLYTLYNTSFLDGSAFFEEREKLFLQGKLWLNQFTKIYKDIISESSILVENTDDQLEPLFPIAISGNDINNLRIIEQELTFELEEYFKLEENLIANSLISLIQLISGVTLIMLQTIPSLKLLQTNLKTRKLKRNYDKKSDRLPIEDDLEFETLVKQLEAQSKANKES